MSHSARSDLVALAERARNGMYEELAGPHSYDPAAATGFRHAAVLALFTPTAPPTSAGTPHPGEPHPGAEGDGAARPADQPSPAPTPPQPDGAARPADQPSPAPTPPQADAAARPADQPSPAPTPPQADAAARRTDLFLVQRSPLLRQHPGQIALPGGSIESDDAGPVAAALRETQEETGIPADQVEVLGTLPPVLVPISRFVVTPVLAWAPAPSPAPALDTVEVLHTLRAGVDDLLDPAGRATVWMAGHGSSGFRLPTGWVWGFTGNLLDHLFTQLGWTREWDASVRHAMSWDEARGAQLLGHVPSPE